MLIYTGFAMSSRAHFYAYILSPDRCYTSAHYHTSSLQQCQAAGLLYIVTGHACPVDRLVACPYLHKVDYYHHLYFEGGSSEAYYRCLIRCVSGQVFECLQRAVSGIDEI